MSSPLWGLELLGGASWEGLPGPAFWGQAEPTLDSCEAHWLLWFSKGVAVLRPDLVVPRWPCLFLFGLPLEKAGVRTLETRTRCVIQLWPEI